MSSLYAQGARVVIRDCERIIRRADPSDDGGYILTVDGLSELVNGKRARFLTCLEEEAAAIGILEPAETRFEQDLTPGFEESRLFIETQLRQITPADARIHLGHKGAMDPVPYQLEPALQALKQNRQRTLISDPVGLGKTLEAGILMTELMRWGRGKRILVLMLKSIMTQFQKEMWNRLTILFFRPDREEDTLRLKLPLRENDADPQFAELSLRGSQAALDRAAALFEKDQSGPEDYFRDEPAGQDDNASDYF